MNGTIQRGGGKKIRTNKKKVEYFVCKYPTFRIVPGAGVENMDIVKCENKLLNPYYRCILLRYK